MSKPKAKKAVKSISMCIEGVGGTLEAAVKNAHSQIPPRPGRDFTISRVVEWGLQSGGFTEAKVFYAKVIEDEHAPFKTQ